MQNNDNLNKTQLIRILILSGIIILMGLVIAARLWYLQVVETTKFSLAANNNRIKIVRTKAPRGNILDRNNMPIAQSKKLFIISVMPDKIEKNKKALKTFCSILNININEYKSIIENSNTRTGFPVRIAVDVPLETIVKLGEHSMLIDGVTIENDFVRYYPHSYKMAHITGYLREINAQQLKAAEEGGRNYHMGDYVGVFGLEKYYEKELQGTAGGQRIEVNAGGRVVRTLGYKPNIPGNTLKLSIDKDLQLTTYNALENRVGAAVALNPQTGEVYCMVSTPSFDPNIFVRGLKSSDWRAIANNKNHPLQNRSIGSVYPPGSVFKPIIALSALENNAATTSTTVNCPGYYRIGNYKKGCWSTHGRVDFYKAVAQSCDTWFYKTSLKLGITKLAKTAQEFGLGNATGIDLYEERANDGKFGLFPDPEWLKERTGEPWRKGDTLNTSIGQGDVLTSPLQMAMVCAAVANKGTVYKPFLVKEIIDINNHVKKTTPKINSKVLVDKKYFDITIHAMEETVAHGTGKRCAIPGIRIAGKTGSAQASRGATHGWFIAFAPVENPTIAVACIVERGESGAAAAAPICKSILENYFKVNKPKKNKKQ